LREQRHPQAKPILGWAVNQSSALRAPTGISHVILDTPGGLYGLDLARIVMFADAILMPICNSVFDRDSAAQCYDELKLLPRIATGRCKLAIVGMRVDNRTLDSAALTQWANERGIPYLGALRDAPTYVQCIEQGVTLFDLPRDTVSQDLAQWQPILDWINPTLYPSSPEKLQMLPRQLPMGNDVIKSARVGSLQPTQQSLVQGERLAPRLLNQNSRSGYTPDSTEPAKRGGIMEALGFPNFLRRK
jgi:chromosome partitioning protein